MQKTILIVEDEKFLLKILEAKLTKSGYQVKAVLNGDEALEVLNNDHVDLIVLDLIMPFKDGFQVLEYLKEDPNLSKIPVIVTSNLGQKEDIDRALRLGAKDYFIKSDTPLNEIILKITQSL